MTLRLPLLLFPVGVQFPGLTFWAPEIQACAKLSLEKHAEEHNGEERAEENREPFSLSADTVDG